ncbi:hypothetical protein C1645_435849 [Glomus cerebriforme]|uniref:PB1 domain-containing protein n=1 Tax=Glomus cerebriforme TaxID=658196 RepID=A0A397TGI4_9GLOM|nr:hypothetical protein C1645_435849 [Glomus cerebriforme]
MVNIKVIHKEAVRRFTLPSSATWIELEAKLRTLFTIPALSPFTLSYTDEDNDIITLSTDIELQEILSSAPTIKFNLKFSTSGDSSDSEDSGNEVWVLEGGNVPPRKRADSVTTIETVETDTSQDNVTQRNIISTTNQEIQEPQYIEIGSRDINETSSNQKILMEEEDDDDSEKVDKKTSKKNVLDDEFFESSEKVDKKTSKKNVLDDEFFESLNSIKLTRVISQLEVEDEQETTISQSQLEEDEQETTISQSRLEVEDEQETISQSRLEVENEQETIPSNTTFTRPSFLEQDQPQDLEVDLQHFQMMIELNQDSIKENPQLVANIRDIMDQIQRLDSYRQPTTHRHNHLKLIALSHHQFLDLFQKQLKLHGLVNHQMEKVDEMVEVVDVDVVDIDTIIEIIAMVIIIIVMNKKNQKGKNQKK